MLQVRRLAADDAATAARWDAFVMRCPDATFFHRAGWQRVLRRCMRHDTHYLFAEQDGGMELRLMQIREVGGRILWPPQAATQ